MWPWLVLGTGAVVVWKITARNAKQKATQALLVNMRRTIATDPQTQGMKWAVVVVENLPDMDRWKIYVEVAYEYERALDAKATLDNMLLKSDSAAFLMDIENGTIEDYRARA